MLETKRMGRRMLESGWCPSWAVGCGAGCPHLSLRDPESPTQCTFQEMAGPLCRRMPGNPALPPPVRMGLFLLARKLQVGFRRVAWGLGWQSTTDACRTTRHSLFMPLCVSAMLGSQSMCWRRLGTEWRCLTHWTSEDGGRQHHRRESTGPCTLYQTRGSREGVSVDSGWAGSWKKLYII